jgi:hypothetical protein
MTFFNLALSTYLINRGPDRAMVNERLAHLVVFAEFNEQ